MANIVITSTDKLIHVDLGDLSSYFDDKKKSSIVKGNVSVVELVHNKDIGDYVQYTTNNGNTTQLNHLYIDSINGVKPTDAENLFEMITGILE